MFKIRVICEAIVVGIYLDILFRIVNIIFRKTSIGSLFFTGFLKHFLGYYLYLHKLFCKFRGKNTAIKSNRFLINCVIEGFVFTIFYLIIKNAFITVFLMHIISEYIGIHTLFIKHSCQY